MGRLSIISPGFHTSIQDLGRFGYRRLGVPISGAMDQASAKLANLLVNNAADHPVFEITMTGPKIQFDRPALIAIAGADMSPVIDGQAIDMNKKYQIYTGQTLSFGQLKTGFRCYLAVYGLMASKTLGSYSQYAGVTEYGKISTGNQFEYETRLAHSETSLLRVGDYDFQKTEIKVYPGPEFELFQPDTIDQLLHASLVVKENSRMGYQLDFEGKKKHSRSITTSNVIPGTVQIVPSGRLMVLMRDAQVTGGYPRIFQLDDTSQNLLAQKKTGDKLLFKLIHY